VKRSNKAIMKKNAYEEHVKELLKNKNARKENGKPPV
jgi:hypothetical protein